MPATPWPSWAIIPKDAAKAIWEGGKKAMAALKADPKGNVEKIDAIERVTKHDVIAFTDLAGRVHRARSRASCTRA